MTCPKTPVGTPTRSGGMDFETMVDNNFSGFTKTATEITQEELDNVKRLMEELNL